MSDQTQPEQRDSQRWFAVTARFEIRAADEDAAVTLISDAVTIANVPGLFPVGTFRAEPTDDPVTRARRRREAS